MLCGLVNAGPNHPLQVLYGYATPTRLQFRDDEEAVKLTKIELREAVDPKAKDFAWRIIASQQKEIAEFDRWLSIIPSPG